MLQLSRTKNQSIHIAVGDTVFTIKVSEIRDGQARLVFDAPQEVKIVRSELLVGKGEHGCVG